MAKNALVFISGRVAKALNEHHWAPESTLSGPIPEGNIISLEPMAVVEVCLVSWFRLGGVRPAKYDNRSSRNIIFFFFLAHERTSLLRFW